MIKYKHNRSQLSTQNLEKIDLKIGICSELRNKIKMDYIVNKNDYKLYKLEVIQLLMIFVIKEIFKKGFSSAHTFIFVLLCFGFAYISQKLIYRYFIIISIFIIVFLNYYTMSNIYYNQKWQQAINDLLEQVQLENMPLEENKNQKGMSYKRTDLQWFQYYAGLYIKYIDIYKKIEDCYDQLVHPQKRILLKQMLDNTMVRLCQIKQNLIRYSTQSLIVQSDFINLEEIIMDLKMTPRVLQIPIPRYFREQKKSKVEQRDQLMLKYLEQYHNTTAPQQEVIDDSSALDSNLQTAVRIIQKLERGRQGIIRGLESCKIRAKFLKEKSQPISEISGDEEESQRASLIQKYWRAFSSRRIMSQLREQEMKFLGMQKQPIKQDILETANKQRIKIKLIQTDHANNHNTDHSKLKKQVKLAQEHNIRSNMLDQRRQWIKKFLEMHEFCDLPKNIEQFYQKDSAQVEDNKQNTRPKKQQQKNKGEKNKKPKKSELQKFFEQHERKGPSQLVLLLQKNIEDHTTQWACRDESDNLEQKYDPDLARNNIRPEVQKQIQIAVDQMISLQLDNMRIKYGLKKKKQKRPRKRVKKQKKVKIPMGLSKKQPQQILAELVQNKIAKILKPAKLIELLGDHNPLASMQQRQAQLMPDPSIAQIRQAITEFIAIPLGSSFAKQRLQKNIWFLFFGPMGSGKTLSIRALQTQCNALIFDLTPSNIQQRYQDKQLIKKLFWMVMIAAKQYQPSIIVIDDFQQIFAGTKKKKKDNQNTFGAKMKKSVVQMKKNKLWTKTDQISVIGCSNKPYQGNTKNIKSLFDKKFYFPYPNYAARKLIFQSYLQQKIGKIPQNFPFNTIAHITEGFTGGSFKIAIQKVLTQTRIKRVDDQPLRLSEFIVPLSNTYCTYSQQYQKLKQFNDQVTGLKQRRQKKKNPTPEQKKNQKPNK